MEVFYVLGFVLVAGAIPCHGRTESEGIVFNKTQLRESMNNVTVSSSKLVIYGILYLAMQWPRSFCNSRSRNQRQCYQQQVPGRFTVHGLWPQGIHGDINCTGLIPPYRPFNILGLDKGLVDDLGYYWPDLTRSVDNHHLFWGYEYNKHGSCTFNNQLVYFRHTRAFAKYLDGQLSGLSGIGRGLSIIPGKCYPPVVIKNAVHAVTNKMPSLRCIRGGNYFLLLEIRFCVVRTDQNNNLLNLDNCGPLNDCPYQRVCLPRA